MLAYREQFSGTYRGAQLRSPVTFRIPERLFQAERTLFMLSLAVASLWLSVASAASIYSVTLPSDLSAGGVMLKAGQL